MLMLLTLNTCPLLGTNRGMLLPLPASWGLSSEQLLVAPFSRVTGCTSLKKATTWARTRAFPVQSLEGNWEESIHALVSHKRNLVLASVEGGLLRLFGPQPKVVPIHRRKVCSIGFTPWAARSPVLIKIQASKSTSSGLRFDNRALILWASNF